MARMHRRWSTLTLASAALLAGCHHTARTTPEFLRTTGFRYRAASAVVGRAAATLRIAVVVLNESRDPRLVPMSSICAPFNRIRAKVTGNRKEWDSDKWRPVKQPETHDDSGRAIIYACPMQAIGLAPGKSETFVLLVAVKDVLGDSLPEGRYHVTASVRISGTQVRGLSAGEVKLSSPPI
jgi:hypothetical protein